MTENSHYVLGHSDAEIERLQLQGACLKSVTRRLIRESGIREGMRVLDIGCGVGDVTLLVAEAVGPSGAIVGVDREPKAIEAARRRTAEAGLDWVDFIVGDDEAIAGQAPFDAAIGRYVLMHQTDPVAMVRRAKEAVKPGGAVAFLEHAFHIRATSLPPLPIAQAAADALQTFYRAALPNYDIAGRLIACYEDAGLPPPRLFSEGHAFGAEVIYWRWLVATYKSLLPHMQSYGMVDPAIGDPATLLDRIVAGARETRCQALTAPNIGAWSIRA